MARNAGNVTVLDTQKINAFHNGCLRKICRIFWPEKITSEKRVAQDEGVPVLGQKSNAAVYDGWDMCSECPRIESQRLHLDGPQQGKGVKVDPKPPGGET